MKKLTFVLFFIGTFFLSCVSTPMPQENIDFQVKTGINLTFVKRGVYSIYKSYNDNGYGDYFDKLVKNGIVFSVDESQKEWVLFTTSDETIYISVNGLYEKYSQSSRNVLMTATVYAIGLIRLDVSSEIIEPRFYEIISNYGNYGLDVSSLLNDDTYVNKKFKVGSNGIAY